MTTSTVTPEIAAFAAAVRDALADLPADDRDELTEGLEADLAEAYAEDLRRELPDPVEYATELRTAAGLPPVEPTRRRGAFGQLVGGLRSTARDVGSTVRENAAAASVLDFLASLRPAWWVVRAWVAAWLLSAMFGSEGGVLPEFLWTWILLLALVVVSVQWGRGRWTFKGLAPVLVIGNVLAALLVAPVVAMGTDHRTYVEDPTIYSSADLTGVYLDGTAVTNIFPYDAEGKPLTDVQLFDEFGNRLETSVPGGNGCIDESTCDTWGLWAARALTNGLTAFNVYPLRMLPAETDMYGELAPIEGAEPVEKPRPFETAPKVVVPETSEKVSPDND